MKEESTSMVIGAFILLFLNMFVGIIVQAYVFLNLWLWFVVPIFGFPVLSLTTALGFSFFLNYIAKRNKMNEIIKTMQEENKKNQDDLLTRALKSFGRTIGNSAGFLFFGWCLHKIIG